MSKLLITLTDNNTDYNLLFKVLNTGVAKRWLEHVKKFIQDNNSVDDPERFYNFDGSKFTKEVVVAKLQELVNTINNYSPNLIERVPGNDITQDDLNYLHHIFEVYHGLYDAQDTNEYFSNAPAEVQQALANLNIWIHRYESLGGTPRFVFTCYGQGNREELHDEDYQFFTLRDQWGNLDINYCEIGKTLYDLWHDNDEYIASEAFKPLHHLMFDFTVRFTDQSFDYYDNIEKQVWNYFDKNVEFFKQQGYSKFDSKLSLGSITVAQIETTSSREEVIAQIAKHQRFKSIQILND